MKKPSFTDYGFIERYAEDKGQITGIVRNRGIFGMPDTRIPKKWRTAASRWRNARS